MEVLEEPMRPQEGSAWREREAARQPGHERLGALGAEGAGDALAF